MADTGTGTGTGTGEPQDELAGRILATVHPSWRNELAASGLRAGALESMAQWTAGRIAEGEDVQPAPQNIFRALAGPATGTRVLILGQDPYPTPGHAVGLSFSSTADTSPVPKSLVNIFTEYESDLGLPRPRTADLSPWTNAGVMLLNRVLTMRAGSANSHRGQGWEEITAAVVRSLASRPLVAVLWGRQAQDMADVVGRDRCILSPHPSPLAAYRGFFGSRPFTRANDLLAEQGADPVDWDLSGQEQAC
ncbi:MULTISPECIES: uracil-DNA glycosylase [unclassified Corynebacterium]|uniref:uracil-DNA glycosylase n=1 Tax=unclassified Corynebacterium TaxID=2624378 RepID=UPI00264B20E8|nr:uracil-DNA glycosylase [Corynebacterium sp.]MDN6386572.1 uracil-DNA glycosylase [Corynebacterium sp.]